MYTLWTYQRGLLFSKLFFYGFWGIVTLLAVTLGGVGVVFHDLLVFYSGGVATIAATETPASLWLPIICTVSLIAPLACISIYNFMNVCYRLLSLLCKDNTEVTMEDSSRGSAFYKIVVAPLQEELVFRGFLLGVLPMFSFLSGPNAFYALLIAGNTIWALGHFLNFSRHGHRGAQIIVAQLLVLLPHFIIGLVLSYEFVKLGIVACLVSHILINAVGFTNGYLRSHY